MKCGDAARETVAGHGMHTRTEAHPCLYVALDERFIDPRAQTLPPDIFEKVGQALLEHCDAVL